MKARTSYQGECVCRSGGGVDCGGAAGRGGAGRACAGRGGRGRQTRRDGGPRQPLGERGAPLGAAAWVARPPGPARAPAMAQAAPAPQRTHSFAKKTFHKPTYCHHCSDLLWGLIGQGYGCEGTRRACAPGASIPTARSARPALCNPPGRVPSPFPTLPCRTFGPARSSRVRPSKDLRSYSADPIFPSTNSA